MSQNHDAFDKALFAAIWLCLLLGSGLAAFAIHELEQREARRAACVSALDAGQSPARCAGVR